jgi:hypothetical protein
LTAPRARSFPTPRRGAGRRPMRHNSASSTPRPTCSPPADSPLPRWPISSATPAPASAASTTRRSMSAAKALEDRQEQLAHRAPFSNTVLEDRLPGSRRVCCGVRSIAGPPARCATSGHNMFRGPCAAMMACMWHFVSRWRCGRTDSGGRLPALGGRSGDVHSGSPIVARRENLWCTVRSACRVASKNSRAGDRVVAAEGNQRP